MRLLRARLARSLTASLISRSVLFCARAHYRRQQSVLDRDRDPKIDIGILHHGVAVEGGINLWDFYRRLHRGFQNEIVDRDL